MDRAPASLRSLERRATVTSGFLAAHAAVTFLFSFPAVSQAVFLDHMESLSLDRILSLVAGVGVLLVVAMGAIVAFLMWNHRAAENLRELHAGRTFTFSPGAVVGWWFVPFANLLKPYQAMHEIWHASDPDEAPIPDAAHYSAQFVRWGTKAPALLAAWWTLWIGSNILDRFVAPIDEPSLVVELLAAFVNLVAAGFAIVVVRNITHMQRARFAAMGTGPRLSTEVGHVVGAREPV